MRICATFLFVALTLALPCSARAEALAAAPSIVVLDFDYRDTSGEARDQTAEHVERLRRFMADLRDDLARSGKFRVVALTCGTAPCSERELTPEELLEEARRAGAKFVLFGAIQKMSTLVQLGSVHVVDAATNAAIIERILSFRGDSDEAWRRAERFVVKNLNEDVHIVGTGR